MTDPNTNKSYSPCLTEISNFFETKLLIKKQSKTGRTYYSITATSINSISKVLNYLEDFPLYSSKYLDYKNWREVVYLILKNQHYEVNFETIQSVKDSMNNKRTEFSWDHLNNL